MVVMATATAAVAAIATVMAAMVTTTAAVAAMAAAFVAMGTATAAVVAMGTVMAATMAATMTAVAGTRTTAATAMAGDSDNNQLIVAAEETTAVATVTAAETATALGDFAGPMTSYVGLYQETLVGKIYHHPPLLGQPWYSTRKTYDHHRLSPYYPGWGFPGQRGQKPPAK